MSFILPSIDELNSEIGNFNLREPEENLLSPPYYSMSPEQTMWTAVIEQAVRDLFYMPDAQFITYQIQAIRKSAYLFFFSKKSSYTQHRDFAFTTIDIDTDIILSALRLRIDEFNRKQHSFSNKNKGTLKCRILASNVS